MKYTIKNSDKEVDIDILYKFSIHEDFGRDIIAFKEKDTIKMAYIHPTEENIEMINDIEPIKEGCTRALDKLLKNTSLDTLIEQKMIISSRNISKYKSEILEEQDTIDFIENKEKNGEIDEKIDQVIQKYNAGQVPQSLKQIIKQKINTILEKKIEDSCAKKEEVKELLKIEQDKLETNLNELRKFNNNIHAAENIGKRIIKVVELAQYCQKQLNKNSSININKETLIEEYEKLERKRLSYLYESMNYNYIKSNTELKKFENKKYEILKSKIDEVTTKISEIENQDATVINNSILSNPKIREGLLFERALRDTTAYVKDRINMQNKIEQRLNDKTKKHQDNVIMNMMIDEENKKDSKLYRTKKQIVSSRISMNAVNKLKNCKLVKNNLVIGIQNLTFQDIKTTVNKAFNYIKNSKIGTNKLSKKIGGFISRRAFKIKKFNSNISSMTSDLENANKRR